MTDKNDEETLSGVLEKILYLNDENYYTVGELSISKPFKQNIVITGTLPAVQCGETLKLTGSWVRHSNYGQQFKISKYESTLPANIHGIKKYLGSGLIPGIGKKYAERITEHFGSDSLRIISEASARLKEIPGIGNERIKKIKKSWEEQSSLREVIIFLQTYGITTSQCLKLVRNYGTNAKKIVQENPYQLAIDIDGIAFPTADKIARNFGLPNESPKRIEAGINYVLNLSESEGHTLLPESFLIKKAAELLDIDIHFISNELKQLIEKNIIVSINNGEDENQYQTFELFNAEKNIAETLKNINETESCLPPILTEKAIEWAQNKAGFDFAPEQTESVRQALTQKISIITGGPGTGKTTILKAICAILQAKKIKIALAAPTGRAAQRMSEATNVPATTIHRLLKSDPGVKTFTHNKKTPIPTDFLIVDEMSMLDTKLASSLFQAIRPSAHLLLVGDINQIPSVGAGNILQDLIFSQKIKTTTLASVFRQGKRSEIVQTAHNILHGISTPPSHFSHSANEILLDKEISFIRTISQEDTCKQVLRLTERLLKTYSIEDIQILAPMHKGIAGVQNLNHSLQKIAKPNTNLFINAGGDTRYEKGDKIIQLKNDYDKNVFNGDLGKIESIDKENNSLEAYFSDSLIEYERNEFDELALAYAITIHKSQGSEFPIVIIPIAKAHFMMLKRNLIYTAITRGREKVFLVGEIEAYSMAIRNTDATKRWTGLPYLLKNQ